METATRKAAGITWCNDFRDRVANCKRECVRRHLEGLEGLGTPVASLAQGAGTDGGVQESHKQGGERWKQPANYLSPRTICRYCVGGNRDLLDGQNPSPKKPAVAAYVCADCGRVLEWIS